jgi:hypothetical protein
MDEEVPKLSIFEKNPKMKIRAKNPQHFWHHFKNFKMQENSIEIFV